MNKLIVLVLALAIAAPALADDLIPPPQNPETGVGETWRGDPGSTYSQWSYDDPCGLYDWDGPDTSSFVTHPDKEDPWQDPCSPGGEWFSAQVWGGSDPCLGDSWLPTYMGRTGVINYGFGSWDLNNFWSDPPQPAKDMWVQITYHNGTEVPSEFEFGPGMGGFDPTVDPCGPPDTGEWEGQIADFTGTPPEEWDTWLDPDPCDPCTIVEWAWFMMGLDEWDPEWPEPLYTWLDSEFWFESESVSMQILADGWIHEVWAMTAPFNPEFEWFEFGSWEGGIYIDQIVIETLCYVPEPATMVLLGLGSLMMIRRKKR